MTIAEAKRINKKLEELVNLFPELHLSAKVTFSKDPFVEGHHDYHITIQNDWVGADEDAKFSKECGIPYAEYENGVLLDSEGDLGLKENWL